MNEKPQIGTVLFEVALLTVVVLLVDERLMRGALALIPAMLLAQRALSVTNTMVSETRTSGNNTRTDHVVREHVQKLLDHFREFYATCHLMGSGGITSEEALQRTNDLEMELNRLLDDVKRGAQKQMMDSPKEEAVAS